MMGSEIQGLREALGLDAFAFAKVLGIHASTLYRWESQSDEVGMDPLQRDILEQLAKKLRVKRAAEKRAIGEKVLAGLLVGGTLAGLLALLAFLMTREDEPNPQRGRSPQEKERR